MCKTSLKIWLVISLFLVAVGIGTSSVFATGTYDDHDAGVRVDRDFGKMPLYFIENQGQSDKEVGFYVQGSDKTLYFTPQGVTFALAGKKGESEEAQRWSVKLDFVGANPDVRPIGEDRQQAVISYFKGKPEDWKTGLPTYRRIVYPELWDGIDLVYSGSVNKLKYEFVVKPGADPKQIQLAYRGAGNVTVRETGELMVDTPVGGFADGVPYAYQEMDGRRAAVSMAYTLERGSSKGIFEYGFDIGPYDTSRPLILDPAVLIYCGYIGGADYEEGRGIAVDDSGNAYVTGTTSSSEASFPEVVGPDLTSNGGDDAFVAKVKADGTALIYCGYIGGDYSDHGEGIAVDADGNAYVTGRTTSTEASFPVDVGPDLTQNGYADAFVAKVNAAGTALDYCGYIGGNKLDSGSSIAVDASGCAYVTGRTYSTEATFPVVVGPDITYNGGPIDAFVAKVKADGTGLDYCGYIGGAIFDYGEGIAVDDSGCAYVTGWTSSSEASFPVAVGPDITYNGGLSDAFVAKVKADGTALVYCGYIGGDYYDWGHGIAVDDSGCAYVTGETGSSEASFPVAVGPDLTFNGGGVIIRDAFVAKVKADGTALVYCGYIGGAEYDYGWGIAVDEAGCAYVTGETGSSEASFPVFVGPDITYNGGPDAFVAKVKADGTALVYCGYIGGTNYESGYGIAVDDSGNAYVTGRTASTEATFPEVVGPDLTHNGGTDAFVAKVVSLPTTHYVDVDASGANNGTSWEDAFNYLQDALAVAIYGDQVWVAEGTYTPDSNSDIPGGTGDRAATFQLVSGVAIKGGYAGFGEPDPNERDVNLYETILSGDIGVPNVNTDNSYHVVTGSSMDETAILDGFTITGGNANGSDDYRDGGGMYNYEGSPTVSNCIFTGNSAYYSGGGMFNDRSNPTLTDCTFTGNWTTNNSGGGMFNTDSSPTVTNCTFTDNRAGFNGGGMCGGNPIVTNCTFIGNSSVRDGGGMGESGGPITNCTFRGNRGGDDGGAMKHCSGPIIGCVITGNWSSDCGGGLYKCSSSVTNCIISGNNTNSGGGIYNHFEECCSSLTNCIISGNNANSGGGMCNINISPIVTNCIFTGNSAYYSGGGMYNYGSNPTLTNCTFSGNSAIEGGGMCNYFSSSPTVTGCILWGNIASSGSNEIYNNSPSSSPVISYCDIAGCLFGGSWDTSLGSDEGGNIDVDPCFVEPGYWGDANDPNVVVEPNDPNAMWVDGDYHLLLGSPCIDAGDNTAVPPDTPDLDGDGNTIEPIPLDLAGHPRFVDQPDVPDTGNGTAPIVDMGAYEANYIEVAMKFTPQALNPGSKGKWVKAHCVLPEGYTVEDVDVNTPATLELLGIEAQSEYIDAFVNEDNLVEVEIGFERGVFCGVGTSDEFAEAVVTGWLTCGRRFRGTDTIKIINNKFTCIAVLASYWLEEDCGKPDWCGGADLDEDSMVNFRDFGLFDGCCIEIITE